MKKTYFTPSTTVAAIATDTMILAGSPGTPSATIDTEESVDPDKLETRRRSIWDEDE